MNRNNYIPEARVFSSMVTLKELYFRFKKTPAELRDVEEEFSGLMDNYREKKQLLDALRDGAINEEDFRKKFAELLEIGAVMVRLQEKLVRRFSEHAKQLGWDCDDLRAAIRLQSETLKKKVLRQDQLRAAVLVQYHCLEAEQHELAQLEKALEQPLVKEEEARVEGKTIGIPPSALQSASPETGLTISIWKPPEKLFPKGQDLAKMAFASICATRFLWTFFRSIAVGMGEEQGATEGALFASKTKEIEEYFKSWIGQYDVNHVLRKAGTEQYDLQQLEEFTNTCLALSKKIDPQLVDEILRLLVAPHWLSLVELSKGNDRSELRKEFREKLDALQNLLSQTPRESWKIWSPAFMMLSDLQGYFDTHPLAREPTPPATSS